MNMSNVGEANRLRQHVKRRRSQSIATATVLPMDVAELERRLSETISRWAKEIAERPAPSATPRSHAPEHKPRSP